METIIDYIRPELLILIPVLYLLGNALKATQSVADKHIPLLLGAAGIVAAVLYLLASSDISGWRDALMAVFVALTQGVLCAGCSVYANQIGKQAGKDE